MLVFFSSPNEFRIQHDIIRFNSIKIHIVLHLYWQMKSSFDVFLSITFCPTIQLILSISITIYLCLLGSISCTYIFIYLDVFSFISFNHLVSLYTSERASERMNLFFFSSSFDSDWIQLSGTVTVACFFRFEFRNYHDIYGLTKYIVFARSLTWFPSNRRFKNVPNIGNNVANVCSCVCANNVVSLHENRNCTHFNNGSNWWECVWHITSDDIVTIFIVFLINKFAYFPCGGHSLAKLSITVSS